MSWWLKLRRRKNLDRDLEDEIAFHCAMRARDEDAPRFGNQTQIQEEIRDMWALGILESLVADARYALRGMRRDLSFAVTAIVLLTLATGANTAMFIVLKKVILDPLPYADADRLVRIYDRNKARGSEFSVTAMNYQDWAVQAKSFESLAAYSGRGLSITEAGEPELVISMVVTPNLFSTLGVNPALGRDFRAEEIERGRDRVMILTHRLWLRKFGGDPGIIGRRLRVNAEAFEVVGVMPPGFYFPDQTYEAFVPLTLKGGDPAWTNRSAHYLRVVGRLRSPVAFDTARAEMDQIATHLEAAYPDTNAKLGVSMRPLKDTVVGDSKALVWSLYAAATVLLLIACANLAGLLVARSSARRAEFATRTALGASKWRLARQMLVEAGILSLVGGAAGLALAYAMIGRLRIAAEGSLPRLDELRLDPAIVAFSLALTALTGIAFGLGPVLSGSHLLETARGVAAQGLKMRTRQALVVVQVALSLVLLVGASLFLRSLSHLNHADRGYDAAKVVTFGFGLGTSEYESQVKLMSFATQLAAGLSDTAGVQAGFSTALPLSGQGWGNPIAVFGHTPLAGRIARIQCVSPGYMEALRMRLRAGRVISRTDDDRAPAVVVVDEVFARTFLSHATNPIGERIKIGDADSRNPWATVVGVVSASSQFSLVDAPEAHIFVPYLQLGSLAPIVGRGIYLVGRADSAATAAQTLKSAVLAVNPTVALRGPNLLSESVDTAMAPTRFRTALMIGFALLALMLSTVGLYGVIAFAVSQQRQEIGVRIALGARPGQIVSRVLASGMRLAAVGIALGLCCALLLASVLESQRLLFGVSSRDAASFGVVVLLLAAVTCMACLLPARRAAATDPMRALRES